MYKLAQWFGHEIQYLLASAFTLSISARRVTSLSIKLEENRGNGSWVSFDSREEKVLCGEIQLH